LKTRKRTPLADRFWVNVDKTSSPDGCWLWTAGTTTSGYGQLRLEAGPDEYRGKKARAHRVAYELCVDEIPEGMSVCHSCDNPLCVNPDHLWIGTHAENLKDMSVKGRAAKGDRSGTSKLNSKQVGIIKRLLSGKKINQAQIAVLAGVSPSSITHISKGHTWREDHA